MERIDVMAIADFLEENLREFCDGYCNGNYDIATEQIDALREMAND